MDRADKKEFLQNCLVCQDDISLSRNKEKMNQLITNRAPVTNIDWLASK